MIPRSLCEASVPKISNGTASGRINKAINAVPRRAPSARAAPITPRRVNPMLPINRAIKRGGHCCGGIFSIIAIRGVMIKSGNPAVSQWEMALASAYQLSPN